MRIWLPALCLAMLAASPAFAATRSYSITSFDRIRVDGPFRVKVTTGVAPFATASGSPEAIDSVSIDIQGRTLIVRGNPSSWGGFPGKASGPVEIKVGTHELSQAWVNGSGTLTIDRIKGLTFDLAMQGSGSAAIGNAAVDQLKIGISGTSTAALSGAAPKLTAIVRGSSSLDAPSLSVKDAVIGAEGPAVVRLAVSNSAKIDARGTSSVEVSGDPACTVKAEGSSPVSGCR
jgi:hypothetical protein